MSVDLIKPVIRTVQRDLIVSGWHPAERVDITIKQRFDTACWTFLPSRRHRIYIGSDLIGRMVTGLTHEQQEHYIASYVAHEFSHALHTERDMGAVRAMLAEIECPFDLFNLFEDARIEQVWRALTARPFRWSELEMIDPAAAIDAAGVLFLLIQGEGAIPTGIAVPDADLLSEVTAFYHKACEASDTLALQGLLADWIDRFGATVPPNLRFLGGEGGELAVGLLLQTDTGFRAAFEADAGEADNGKDGGGETGDEEGAVAIDGHIADGLLSDEETYLDDSETARLASRFEPLFRDKTRSHYSEQGSKRISAARFALGRPCFQHRADAKARTRKIGLVVDCSGSMGGIHIEAGRQLIAALNLLARHGRVTGALVLSGVSGHIAMSESFTWPVADEVIRRIHAFGDAEGLQSAITHHAAALSGCDQVFVFTDGQITDSPLRLSPLRSRGVFVCGLYVGSDPRMSDHMARHFDRFYMRETLVGLIDALLSGSARNRA